MVAQTHISTTMIKWTFLLVLLATGCASQPQSFTELDMINFVPDCRQARYQVDYLQKRIDAYNEWFRSHTPDLQDLSLIHI